MKKTFQIAEFSKYLIKAGHWRGHGIHSPFMYDFVRNTLMKANKKDSASRYHNALKSVAPKATTKSTFGSKPSSKAIGTVRLLHKISTTKKYGKLLNTIVANYKPLKILELGTGLGLSTYYLATGNSTSQVITVEGMEHYSAITKDALGLLAIDNVTVINSSFEDFFLNLNPNEKFDLIFIDGSHSYQATLPLFNRVLNLAKTEAFIILDDIRWSRDMFKAWHDIKMHSEVHASLDLGRIGIVFLNPNLQKQHHTIRY